MLSYTTSCISPVDRTCMQYASNMYPPRQEVKLIRGVRFRAAKRGYRVRIPGVRLFPARISDDLSPHFHVINVFREWVFALRKGIQADAQSIRSSCNFRKKRVQHFLSSTWTREDVETHLRLRVESPKKGRDRPRKGMLKIS